MQEHSTVFEPWNLKFAKTMLGGIILRQEVGGFRLVSFNLDEEEGALASVLEYYGNESAPIARVGYRFSLPRLREMTREDDPASAAGIYLDDLMTPNIPEGSEPIGGTYWISRPPVAG